MMAESAEIASPCTKVCVMDQKSGCCVGCYRTLEEIAGWSEYSTAEKLAVLERVKARRARAQEHH